MGRLNSGIRIRDNFLSEWFFLFQKIKIDSVNHADSTDQTFDSITWESDFEIFARFLEIQEIRVWYHWKWFWELYNLSY